MTHRITLIPGDGIGPEIADAMRRVVAAAGADIEWDVQDAGEHVIADEGTPLPARVLDSIRENRVAIKGPITTPVGYGFRSINVELRKQLDLYVNLRPALSIPGTGARYDDVDIVLFRENTEDLYAGIEFDKDSDGAAQLRALVAATGAGTIRDDAGISIKPISEYGTRRIMRAAMDYAIANNRRKVTIVHKANIMKHTDGLYLRVAREVAAEYAERAPHIEVEDFIVDATCMRLVIDPTTFDVLVCPNLFGDIVSDLCAGLVGGLGLAPGANIGDTAALFEPVHGSAPAMAGKDRANPTALILTAELMLRHIEQHTAADRLRTAVTNVIARGEALTYDLHRTRFGTTDGAVGTQAFADAIVAELT
ncbi:MAG: isocitrate/isopropylmalate dehydrogenase family protein [Actinomycetes bacterium]|nr:isocitrate/isopropylmalate dehydrogenase family protein [Actinomycetes bacterium]